MSDHRPEVGAGVTDVDMSGRTVLVTGATSGIGRETALALARLGATVLAHGRDEQRGAAVVDELRTAGPGGQQFLRADFGDLDAVTALAEAAADHGPPDVLVNNAGGYFTEPRLTDAGVEYTLQVNHLAPFLLTHRLRSQLPADGRVVTVASEAHRRSDAFDFTAVRTVDDYSGWRAYCRSKLANVLFTRSLATRLDGPTANCLHPGVVPGSGFLRHLPAPIRLLGPLANAAARLPVGDIETPAQAAETSVYLAASPDVADTTGTYFDDCEPREPSAAARDERAAERLWELSADLTGIEEPIAGE